MDKKRIRRIIAKEGLIFAGVVIFTFCLWVYSSSNTPRRMYNFYEDVMSLPLFAYCVYLLIRFITWAIKTLKEK